MDLITLALAKKLAGSGGGGTGTPGKDGKSAYEIAIENGFDGTEEEWLDSLKGADGTTPDLQIGTVETLEPGSEATVSITGTSDQPVLSFGIPEGVSGKDGKNGTDGFSPTITENVDNNDTLYKLDITTKEGKIITPNLRGENGNDGIPATISIGDVTTGNSGTNASVTNTGTASAAVFNFVIPAGKKGEKGEKGEKGDPFTIAKTFSSVEEMNSGFATDEVLQGSFVVIDTGNVEDEDNAKLYIKGESSYDFITDLSGAQGIKGEKGDTGEKGNDGANGKDGVAATISVGKVSAGEAGTDPIVHNSGTSNVAVFDFTIPKGDPGTTVYGELSDKPSINGVILEGAKTFGDLGIQSSTDDSLNTTDKTIVGAINELLAKINALTPAEGKALLTVPTGSSE